MGQHQSLANDKGTELSLRVAINKLIESCLSNPQSTDGTPDEEDTMKNQLDEEDCPGDTNSNSVESLPISGDKAIDNEKGKNATPDKSMSSAQSISSLLEMHIRDMIVNCENEEELDKKKDKKCQSPVIISSSSVQSTTDPSYNCNSTDTKHTVSSAICSSVTSGLRASGMSSVPLQTLVDKVLDNSLGEPSVFKPIDAKLDSETSKQISVNDSKSKTSGSYEIAAEPAKAVSEKVTRCVEKNQNNNEDSASSKPGEICLMAHIEKALERNFAQMYEAETVKSDSIQVPLQSENKDKKKNSQSSTVVQSDSVINDERNKSNSKINSVGSIINPRQTLVTNPDGTISVQDIVDRIFSQTEMISKLLTPGIPSSTTRLSPVSAKNIVSTPSAVSQQSFERSIVKTVNSSKLDTHSHAVSQSISHTAHNPQPMKHNNSADAYKQSKSTGSVQSRDDFNSKRHAGLPVTQINELPDKHLSYNQTRHKEPTPYHKSSMYGQPDMHRSDTYIDPRVLNEVQRQAVVRENMMMLGRFPYSMPITHGVDPSLQTAHPLLRYCSSGPLMQQRLPPPLLRVDPVNDSSLSSQLPHPYNKSCPCITCSSQRAHMDDLKRSPKQHPSMLLPANSLLSPSNSPHYQSRLSPHTRDMRNLSPHSPQSYGSHQSAFTRVKDSIPEREKSLRIYTEDIPSQRKSRIDNGIEMLYRERKSLESYRQPVDTMCSKTKHHPIVHVNQSITDNDIEVKSLSYGMKYRQEAEIVSQIVSDQPLDLSKKRSSQIEHRDYIKQDSDINYGSSKPQPSDHRPIDYRQGHATNTHTIPQHTCNDAEVMAYRERSASTSFSSAQYSHRIDASKYHATPAAMTPGMMPDKLGSPAGIRPQLHPLPSPTLSTSYNNRAASQSPQVSCYVLPPNDNSPDSERGILQVTEGNLSRPSSQCSSSPSDPEKERKGSVSRHEPVQNIIGTHPPSDILYLICRLCRQTYGSPYGFRKHFRNQHGFEPRAEHTVVHTISATKNAMQHIPGMPNEIHSPTGFHPVTDGSIFENIDIPKVRERAASDSKLLKSVSNQESDRPICSRSAESRQTVVTKGESDDTKCLKCEQCNQTFQLNDFGSYKRHCRQHNQTRTIGPFHCQLCSSSFQEPQLLEEHMLKHESESFVCKYCKIPYAHKTYLDEHVKNVHGAETLVNINSCKYCHVTFVDYKELLIHIQSVHGTRLDQTTEKRVQKKVDLLCESRVTSHVDIQEADQMTTLSCPDSSSDNVAERARSLSNSPTSENKKLTATEPPKSDNIVSSNENSQDNVSSLGYSGSGEENFYKHKKFFGHRKRKESTDSGAIPAKCVKSDSYNSVESNKCDSDNSDNSVSCSSSTNFSEQDKGCDSSIVNRDSTPKHLDSESSTDQNSSLNKQEARHQMPFVWDRITRSQAGKNIRPPDYMA